MTSPAPTSEAVAHVFSDPATGQILGSISKAGVLSLPGVQAGGLPGTSGGLRLVGLNATGAPASGKFQAGDLAGDLNGVLYLCTAGGSPGTWVAGSGTVTGVSVAAANGFTGSVASPSTTPAISVGTSVTGLLKGNGTAVSAATPGTDYLAPGGSGAALTGITASQVGADTAGAATTAAAAAQAAAEAYANPMTAAGDTIIGGTSGTPARLAGNTTAVALPLVSQGTGSAAQAPAFKALPGQYLCAPSSYAPASQSLLSVGTATMAPFAMTTTVASASNGGTISGIGSWATPSAGTLTVASTTGFPSSGTLYVSASGSTVATVTYTGTTGTTFTGCAYVSGSASGTVATGGLVTFAASSSQFSTNAFTAPASGQVVVTLSFAAEVNTSGAVLAVGLAAHGTITPMLSNASVLTDGSSLDVRPYSVSFYVTGLTGGNSYQFDVLGCVSAGGIGTVAAIGTTSATPSLASAGKGAPVVLTVQAV